MADGLGSELVWHRRTVCESGACVEVAVTGDAVMVRSSLDPEATPVTLSRDEWRAFLAGAKEGAFDNL